MKDIRAHHGLRGLASFWVFLGHAEFDRLFPGETHLHTLYSLFYWHNYAVDVFFVLSGFILNYLYLYHKKLVWKDFFSARLARLMPLYYTTTAIVLVMNAVSAYLRQTSAPNIVPNVLISNLFMVQTWPFINITSINFPAWSISTEMFLYIVVFPLAALVPISVRKPYRLWVLCAAVIGGAVYFLLHPTQVPEGINPILRGIWGFVVGITLCDWVIEKEYTRKRWQEVAFLALMLTSLIVIGRSIVPITIVCVVYLSYYSQTLTSILLSFRPFIWLGAISYSLYLWHYPIIKILSVAFHIKSMGDPIMNVNTPFYLRLLYCVATTASVLLVAWASYYFFELPVRNRLHRRRGDKG